MDFLAAGRTMMWSVIWNRRKTDGKLVDKGNDFSLGQAESVPYLGGAWGSLVS